MSAEIPTVGPIMHHSRIEERSSVTSQAVDDKTVDQELHPLCLYLVNKISHPKHLGRKSPGQIPGLSSNRIREITKHNKTMVLLLEVLVQVEGTKGFLIKV